MGVISIRPFLRAFAALVFFAQVPAEDTITLLSGGELKGTILQQTPTTVTLRVGYGTMGVPVDRIRSIAHTDPAPAPALDPAVLADRKLPPWNAVVDALAKASWAIGLKQIPATVIDVGLMQRVPYTSYRCGKDYEINVYGDPDDPVCYEIGMYRDLLTDSAAKTNAITFASEYLLHTQAQKARLAGLKRDQDAVTQDGLTLEITPPTAADAYGGWWVSVYFQDRVERARASEQEVAAISVQASGASGSAGGGDVSQPKAPVASAGTDEERLSAWQPADLTAARRISGTSSVHSGSTGGRVYVRSYYRKDGTYVRAHTRKR